MAISFHSDLNAQSSARPVHLRERLDAVVPTTEQYLVHHTRLRRLLGTSPYLHTALGVCNEEFRFRRHRLGSGIRDARQPQRSDAANGRHPLYLYRSLCPYIRHRQSCNVRRGIESAPRPHHIKRGATSQGKNKCHAAEARLCAFLGLPRGMTGLEQNGHVCASCCREADLEGARSREKKPPPIIKFGGRMGKPWV